MTMIHRTMAFLLAACALAAPATASGQRTFGPSIEAGLGMWIGGGGVFDHRGGPAVDAVLAVPLGRTGAGTLVAGLTASASGYGARDLDCIVAPNGGCLPDFPTFVTVGAVAGIQRQIGSRLSARALAGPAYYQGIDGPDAMALQGRLDVAAPLIFRTSLVASLRGAVLPRYEGETLSYTGLGLGLRIQ